MEALFKKPLVVVDNLDMATSSDQLDLDALVDLTSPQSSVDASSRDRAVVQEGKNIAE